MILSVRATMLINLNLNLTRHVLVVEEDVCAMAAWLGGRERHFEHGVADLLHVVRQTSSGRRRSDADLHAALARLTHVHCVHHIASEPQFDVSHSITPPTLLPTAVAREVMRLSPSVLSVRLFPLYLRNRLTINLELLQVSRP